MKNKIRMRNILLIIGMPGSGKTEAAKIAKILGYKVFAFGDIIREEVRRRGLKLNKENMQKVSLWFHDKRDKELVRRLEKKLQKIKTRREFIVLDGPRSPNELSLLRKHGFNVKTLVIDVPSRIRWKRQLARGRQDLGSLSDVRARDVRELKYGIKKLIKTANFKIKNTGSRAQLHSRIKKLLSKALF